MSQNTQILRVTYADGSSRVYLWSDARELWFRRTRSLSEDDVSKLESGGQVEKHGRVFVLEEDEVV